MPRDALRRSVSSTLPLLLVLGLAVLVFHSAWASPATTTVGYRGDADGTVWDHAWMRYAVAHHVSPLLTDRLNYPSGVNLAWQTAQQLPALLGWPVAAGAGPYAAYDVVATLAVALSAWFAYMVIRRWVPRRPAAFVGALVYGFSPYVMAHSLGHLNLSTAWMPPLMLAVLDEIVVRRRRPIWQSGLALGALATAQLYIGVELLATEVIMAAIGLVLLAVMHARSVGAVVADAARALVVALLVFAVCGSWLLGVQLGGPHRMPAVFQHPGGFSSDLLNFVVPTAVQQVQPGVAARVAHHFTGNVSEQNGYLGLPLLLILAYTVWRFRAVAWVRMVALLGGVAAVMSMGPTLHVDGHGTHLPLPWVVIEHTPLLANLLPSRLMVYAYLMAALLLALFVDHVMRDGVALGARAGGGVLVLAALAALLPRFDFPASSHDDPRFFLAGGDVQRIAEGASVLVAPFVARGDAVDPEAWQTRSDMRFRMPEGYFMQPSPAGSGTHLTGPALRPLSQAMLDVDAGRGTPVLTTDLRAHMAADLQLWQTRAVIVGPMPHHGDMVQLFTSLLGSPPVEDQGVEVWWSVQPEVLSAASSPMSWSYTYTSKRS